jgi:hypothetical protein
MRLDPLGLTEQLDQLTVPGLLTPANDLRRLQQRPRTLPVTGINRARQLEDPLNLLLDEGIRHDQLHQLFLQCFRVHPRIPKSFSVLNPILTV